MSLWICTNDQVAYSVGAPACPQCGADKPVEEGSPEHLALPALGEADPVEPKAGEEEGEDG